MKRLTVAFALSSAVFSVLFGGLFVLDLRGFFSSARDPVAFLKGSTGTVRRLAQTELTWDRAEEGTLFGAGDTISTGELARAKLVFYAGGELELEAGSMVVLAGDVEELKLDFVSGTGRVRVAKDAAKKITVGDGSTGKSTAPGVVKRKPRVQVAIVEKLVVPQAPPKQDLALAAQVKQREEAPRADLGTQAPQVADAPGSGSETAVDTGTVSAAATGTAASPDASTVVDTSQESPPESTMALAPAIQEEKIREPEKALGAGKKESGGEILSEIRLPPVPAIRFPESDTVIDLGVQRGSKLEWEMPEDFQASSYEVVVRPADGQGAERVLRSRQKSLALNHLPKGKYLWSVRAIDGAGKRGPASDARWLEVKVPSHMSKPKVLPVRVE